MPEPTSLNEMLIVVHFEPALNLDIMLLANWANSVLSDYPIVQQTPPSPSVSPDLNQERPGIIVRHEPDLHRLYLRSKSGTRTVQLQTDRFGFGWAKPFSQSDAEDEYPGYEAMLIEWKTQLARFLHWHETYLGGRPIPKLLELDYYNTLQIKTSTGRRKLSELFRFIPQNYRPMNSFNMVWSELLRPAPQSPRVTAQATLVAGPDGEPAFNYVFAGFAPYAADPTSVDAANELNALHERIIDMRSASIISET